MRLEYITELSEAETVLYTIATSEDKAIGSDTETTGLDCHTGKMRLFQMANNGIAYILDVFAIGQENFKRIINKFFKIVKGKKIFIFHNFKFDVQWFWKLGIDFTGQLVFDTMLAAKVIECGLSTSASLKEVMERYLDIPMDKTEQLSDWGARTLTSSQLGYAAKDVLKLKALAHELQQDLKAGDLLATFRLEMRAVYGFAMMEYYGIKLDLNRLKQVRPYYEDNLSQARHKFLSLVPLRYVRKNLLGDVIDDGIEPTSATQVLEVLRELGIPNPLYNENSKDEKERDPIIPSTGSPLLKMVDVHDYPIVEGLLDHRKASKILSSYIYNLPELVNKNTGRLHTDFNQIISTGRSCLAKGTKVTTVGGYKNIEDVQVGDLVYTYTNDGKLTIRKVLNVWNKGVRPTVTVKWQSSGTGETGELVCTPDHLFKTKYKGWVEAKDLKRYDKVYHLSRRNHFVEGALRPRLYGTHNFMQLEQTVIKNEYFRASSELHIHHKDGDASNNTLDNLTILSKEDHARLHARELVAQGRVSYQSLQDWYEAGNKRTVLSGKLHPNYKLLSKYSLLKLLAKYKGRIAYIPGDFATFKKKCKEHGLDYVAISQRYTSNGVYLSKGLLKANLSQTTKFSKDYKVDLRKFNKLREYYGLENNHTITSVSEHIPLEVWDIEVEETNNFIANELCVHNSSTNPNLNQLPRPSGKEPLDASGKPLSIRSCFVAEDGYKFALADFSQIELRVMASVCGDENMLEEFRQQKDPYSSTAAFLSNTPYEELVVINPHGEDKVKPEYKKLRQNAKAVRLGLNYGMWWKKLRNYARQQYGVHMTQEEAKGNYDRYFEAYPGLKRYHNTFNDSTLTEARTLPPFNRRRLWEVYPGVPSMCNLPIQGSSGDIQKLAIATIYEELHRDGFSPTANTDVRLVLTVHDELEIEAKDEYAEYARELLQRNMVSAGEFVIKDCPILADAAIVNNLAEKD